MQSKDPVEKPDLQKTIDNLLNEMSSIQADSDEYAKMTDQLVKLYSLKEVDSKRRVSPDTLAAVIANFLGIVWITRYERENVLTTKAMEFIRSHKP